MPLCYKILDRNEVHLPFPSFMILFDNLPLRKKREKPILCNILLQILDSHPLYNVEDLNKYKKVPILWQHDVLNFEKFIFQVL